MSTMKRLIERINIDFLFGKVSRWPNDLLVYTRLLIDSSINKKVKSKPEIFHDLDLRCDANRLIKR